MGLGFRNSLFMSRTSSKQLGKIHQRNDRGLEDSDLDEIDHFHASKQRVLFSDKDNSQQDEEDYETIMDLPDEEDQEGKEDYEDKTYDLFSEEEEGDFSDEEGDWGKSKQVYYDQHDDTKTKKKTKSKKDKVSHSLDEDTEEEEYKEAMRLRHKHLNSLEQVIDSDGNNQKFKDKKKKEPCQQNNQSSSNLVYFDSESEEDDIVQDAEESTEEMTTLVQDYKERLSALNEHVIVFNQQLRDKQATHIMANSMPPSHILSLLKVKHDLLQGYCTYVALFLNLKTTKKSLKPFLTVQELAKHDELVSSISTTETKNMTRMVLERLVQYRLLLEKIRPLELKARPHLEKLLEAARKADATSLALAHNSIEFIQEDRQMDEDEAMARPRLEAIDDKDEEDKDATGSSLYKAPHINPTLPPDMSSERDARRRQQANIKSKLLKEALLDEDEEDFDDNEDDRSLALDPERQKAMHHLEERRAYEEEHLIRLSETRQDKKAQKQAKRLRDDLDDINDLLDNVKEVQYGDYKDKDLEDVLAKKNKKTNSKKIARLDKDEDIASFSSSMSEIEDDAEDKDQKKKYAHHKNHLSKERASTSFKPIVDLHQGVRSARPVTYQILKNRGAMPKRSKDLRNPRVHQRKRFERASKKLGSFKAVPRATQNTVGYQGEKTGIRSNLSRSMRFK